MQVSAGERPEADVNLAIASIIFSKPSHVRLTLFELFFS